MDAYRGPLRVLVAAHSHPQISNGGAEIASYQLFRSLQERDACEAWFLGCDRTPNARLGVTFSQPYGDSEYVYHANAFDVFKFANLDPKFRRAFEELIKNLAPNIVHFHHYLNFGVEAFQHVKRAAPDCRIVLTLHEYLGICHHYGQMVTKKHYSLCHHASPRRCSECFPEISRADFFLRRLYIERFFKLVDIFIAPSKILGERYINWGVPAAKVTVLENLTAPNILPIMASSDVGPLRIGFFGQISPLKGVNVIFDAAALLEKDYGDKVSFEIFGDYLGQPIDFQEVFLKRLEKGGPNIRFHGAYDRLRVDRLMQSVHAVLVPSIWWENSPVVIQEALRNRRPVICSDIGGMVEKVRDGIDGFHFPLADAPALANLLQRLTDDRSILAKLTAGLSGMPSVVANVRDYVSVYRDLSDAAGGVADVE